MKLLLIFFCTFVAGSLRAQFDINDPKNPDCPCHKYQKIADEEYKRLLARAATGTELKNKPAASIGQPSVPVKKENRITWDHAINITQHKRMIRIQFPKKNFSKRIKMKKCFRLRRKKANDSCFSWK